ncbi:hypothetical protein E4T56_gene11633 [Termitomyces sp. T112]|nr:hypothetical protein E4T56_gene11633 [Termitomyces sp. T112]
MVSTRGTKICKRSLPACNEELSWEDSDSSFMTMQAVVRILRSNPHPQIHHFLCHVSHHLHAMYLWLRDSGPRFRKRVRELNKKRAAKGLPPWYLPLELELDMDNCLCFLESVSEL